MAVDENKLPNGRVDFHGKHPGPLPKEKPLKLADFYAARISTPPTLQWMVLSPPYTQREIAGKPFHQIHAARFELSGQTYLVSIAFAGEICSMGANTRNKVVRTTRGKACSVSPMLEDTVSNQADTTQVRFDPVTKTVAFRSLMDGKFVRVCQRTLRLP